MSDFAEARQAMVDSQIRPSDVTDRRLLAAFESVPRELFTPRSKHASAYADAEVGTSDQRRMMRPRDLAKLIHAADVQSDELVLDIACGRGYSTAILARMAETVVGVENDEDGLSRASGILSECGADNAVVIDADPKNGMPDQGPYNVIFVNGAVEEVPQTWLDQLAEGGRLAVVVRKGPVGKATIFSRSAAGIGERVVFDAAVSPLPGFEREQSFSL